MKKYMNKYIKTLGIMGLMGVSVLGGVAIKDNTPPVQSAMVEKIDSKNIKVAIPAKPMQINIDSLKRKLTSLNNAKIQLSADYQKSLEAINEQISTTEQIISQAQSLGVQ